MTVSYFEGLLCAYRLCPLHSAARTKSDNGVQGRVALAQRDITTGIDTASAAGASGCACTECCNHKRCICEQLRLLLKWWWRLIRGQWWQKWPQSDGGKVECAEQLLRKMGQQGKSWYETALEDWRVKEDKQRQQTQDMPLLTKQNNGACKMFLIIGIQVCIVALEFI